MIKGQRTKETRDASNICVTTLIWFYGFNNLVYLSVAHIAAEVAVLQFFGFGQNRSLSWPGCIYQLASMQIQFDSQCVQFLLEQMFQFPRMHISVGQHACSVAQSMYSVGQNRCFNFPRMHISVGQHACLVAQPMCLVG